MISLFCITIVGLLLTFGGLALHAIDRVEFSIVIVRMLNGPLLRLGVHLKRGFQDLNSRVQVVRLTASSVPSGGELHIPDIRFVPKHTELFDSMA